MREALAAVKNSRLAFFLFPVVNELDRTPVGNMQLIAFAEHPVE